MAMTSLIGEDGERVGRHLGEVVARQQRRGEHRPQAHVGAVFVQGQLAVADLEHVGIVPVAGAGVLGRGRPARSR